MACAENWAREDDELRAYMGQGILECLDDDEYENLSLAKRVIKIKVRMKKSIDNEMRNFFDEAVEYKKEVLDDDGAADR